MRATILWSQVGFNLVEVGLQQCVVLFDGDMVAMVLKRNGLVEFVDGFIGDWVGRV